MPTKRFQSYLRSGWVRDPGDPNGSLTMDDGVLVSLERKEQ